MEYNLYKATFQDQEREVVATGCWNAAMQIYEQYQAVDNVTIEKIEDSVDMQPEDKHPL